jgi:hypothetical protein
MIASEDHTAALRRQDGGGVTQELRALPSRSTQELKQTWQTLLGTQPPAKLSRDLLIRVIADKLQETALGGLAPPVKRRLAALARRTENGADTVPAHPMLRLKPGTKLVRAWRGKTLRIQRSAGRRHRSHRAQFCGFSWETRPEKLAYSVDRDVPKPPASPPHLACVAAFAPLSDLRLAPARRVPRWCAWQRDTGQTDRCEIGLMDQTSALPCFTVGTL